MNNKSNLNHGMNTIKRASKNQISNQAKNNNIKKNTINKGNTGTVNSSNLNSINRPLGSTIYSQNKKNLDKMLRDYQNFCKKYFGESTPIGAISEERMNKILEDDEGETKFNKINYNDINNNYCNNVKKNTVNKNYIINFDFLKDDIYNFSNEKNRIQNTENLNSPEFIFSKINKLGYHKNDKNDYIRRTKKVNNINEKELKQEEKTKEEKNNKKVEKNIKEKEKEKENEKEKVKEKEKIKEKEKEKEEDSEENEYNDFEEDDSIKKEKGAVKIQEFFKSQKCPKRIRDRIFFGNDSKNEFIIWIYIDKINSKTNEIKSLFIKKFSLVDHESEFMRKDVNTLLNKNFVSKEELSKNISNIIDKILGRETKKDNEEINKEKEENQKEEDDEDYSFDNNDKEIDKKEKDVTLHNDAQQSISSIGQCDYDGI